jgi:glycosyltransferase involved in cell wall biosynthesis
MNPSNSSLIKIFTPSFADADNTNAQNLTVKEIVARLPADKFHVTMLCEGGADQRLTQRKNTRLIRWVRHGNTLRLLCHCLFDPPDVYFFPRTGPLDRLFFDFKKRLRLRTPIVTYIVMAMNEETGKGMIARSIAEGDMVLGNSKHVSDTIQKRFGVHAEAIHDGVDRRYYFPSTVRSANTQLTVLYAGSFQPRKRVEMVIQHAARYPAVNFRLAGAGETEGQCRDLARKMRCSNVTFLGHLSSTDLGEEMRNADIFFFPSILEGNPQVLLQASACGLPSIAMDLYHTDYVVDGKTGFHVRSDAELSARLDQLLDDASLRQAFAAAAINHSLKFDWDDIAKQWGHIFRRTMQEQQHAQVEKRCVAKANRVSNI